MNAGLKDAWSQIELQKQAIMDSSLLNNKLNKPMPSWEKCTMKFCSLNKKC